MLVLYDNVKTTLSANYVIFRDMFPSSVRMSTVLSKTDSEILRCVGVCVHTGMQACLNIYLLNNQK